jgi:hypothetical protein
MHASSSINACCAAGTSASFSSPFDVEAHISTSLPIISAITTHSTDDKDKCRPTNEPFDGCYTSGKLSTASDTYVYGDRGHTFTKVPEFLNGMPFIRAANDDKRSSADDREFLCFNIDMQSTVFVLYDSRASSVPSWLSTMYANKHEQSTFISDPNMADGFEIFYGDMPTLKGQVCMGGNGDLGAGNNYIIVIVPLSNFVDCSPCVHPYYDLDRSASTPCTPCPGETFAYFTLIERGGTK